MKQFYSIKNIPTVLSVLASWLLTNQTAQAQTATVATPLAIGRNTCNGATSYYNAYNYIVSSNKLVQTSATNCSPSLANPGFSASSGSIAFNPKDQMVYYIETSTGNNSIVWKWSPDPSASCPTGKIAATYTYTNTFVVGLDFSPVDQNGYQIEFSTGSAPYTMYLRQVTSFGPPLVAGSDVTITLPAGKQIYSQNGDLVFTPTGQFYFAYDNKLFSLDYTTYSTGVLNAVFIDSLRVGAGKEVVGLAYINGNFVASVTPSSGSGCSYQEINISTGSAVLTTIPMYNSNGTTASTFSATDMATLITGIGAAKTVDNVSSWLDGIHYDVRYYVKVKNYGNVNLTNVQVTDSLAKLFGTSFVSATLTAVGSLPSGLTLNPSFDGNTNSNFFSSGSTMKASPIDSATIEVDVLLANPNFTTIYQNTASATATGSLFGNSVKDSSNNSTTLSPDPNGNDVPDDANEGVPTPLQLGTWTILSTNIHNFYGILQNSAIDLKWTLENQQAGQSIYIQRSADGESFENLSELAAEDSSTTSYAWIDQHPLEGYNYYRLHVVTASGKNFYSNVIAINDYDIVAGTLAVLPNPFQQIVSFTLSLQNADNITYRVIDLSSRQIQSGSRRGQSGANRIDIDNLSELPGGVYILEVDVGGSRYFKKLIKTP